MHNTEYQIPDQIGGITDHGVVRASLVGRVLKVAELAIKPGANPYRIAEMTIAAIPQLQELVSAMRWQLDATAPPSLLKTVESLV